MADGSSVEQAFGEAVGRLGPALLVAVDGLEKAFRRLHPPAFASLQAALTPAHGELTAASEAFAAAALPAPALSEMRDDLLAVSDHAERALGRFVDPGDEGTMGIKDRSSGLGVGGSRWALALENTIEEPIHEAS